MMPVKIREGAMAMLEVRSVPNLLGTPVSYAYAVKAGPWFFLTGHEAFDFESGIPEELAGPSGFPLFGRPRSRREGDFILQRMRRILREFGSDLGTASASTNIIRPLLPSILSHGPARRIRRLHPPEHLGGHGALLRRRDQKLHFADRGDAGI